MSHAQSAADDYAAALSYWAEGFASDWDVIDWQSGQIRWRTFRPRACQLPLQGWKIHVTAAAIEAAALGKTAIQALLALRAPFKIARSIDDVELINSGDAGIEQLGKVVTVYALDDDHARAVLQSLDSVWPRSSGPRVRTDLRSRPGAAVSFRYGVFGSDSPIVISSCGIYSYALTLPCERLIADERVVEDVPLYPGVVPPVSPCSEDAAPIRIGQPLSIGATKVLPMSLITKTARAQTYLGMTCDDLDTVVLKVGYPGAAGDRFGRDMRTALRREFDILTRLGSSADLAPKALAWSDGHAFALLMEDFRGPLLSDLPRQQCIAALPSLAQALARLHDVGVIHCDIKLDNAVLRATGVGLLDFELALAVGDATGKAGTPGHVPPEAVVRYPATHARDIYALAGCVAHAYLCIPPALLPVGVGRLRGLLDLEGAHGASCVVTKLADNDPGRRPTARAAAALLLGQAGDAPKPPSRGAVSTADELKWCRRAAMDAGVLTSSYLRTQATGRSWRNEHFMASFDCEALNIGAAGIVLGLISIDTAAGRDDFRNDIAQGCDWLASRPPMLTAAGLFTGDAGVALALSVAGSRFANATYRDAGKSRFVSACSRADEIDLFSGMAGVIWTACLLHTTLREDWPLQAAAGPAEILQSLGGEVEGLPVWAFDPAAEEHYLGCAHGSIGVAMTLGWWGKLTRQRALLENALEVFQRVHAIGRVADGSAFKLSIQSHRFHAVGNWCHGVGGYLWAMLQLFGDEPGLRREIDWAVATMAASPSVATATYCHGLAGHLELWRLIAGIPRFATLAADKAGKVVRALRLLHHKKNGRCAWTADDPSIVTPDLWVGFLGPATALALHAAGSRGALLSQDWLARCARHAGK
jgi:hypothetical protein